MKDRGDIQYSFGLDPEMMIRDRVSNQIVSAIPILKCNKERKIDLGDGFFTYADNVLIECNVPPSYSKEELLSNVDIMFSKLNNLLGNRYSAECVSYHHFSLKECSHNYAKQSGCLPTFDAFSLEMCESPELHETGRAAGGHCHWGRHDFKECKEGDFLIDPMSKCRAVKWGAYYLGLPSIILDDSETSRQRKRTYGYAFEHRPSDFGVEYRCLSNFWINRKELVEFIYDMSILALEAARNDEEIPVPCERIGEIVRYGNTNDAKNLIKEYFPQDLQSRIVDLV